MGKEIVNLIAYTAHSNEFSGPRALRLIHYLRRTGILDCVLCLVCVFIFISAGGRLGRDASPSSETLHSLIHRLRIYPCFQFTSSFNKQFYKM